MSENKLSYWSMMLNSILCTVVCWIVVNYFVFEINIFKFAILELFLTGMHSLFTWGHTKLADKFNKQDQ
jgi:hypothetical protein